MTTSTPSQARDALSQIDAEARAARIANVSYELRIELTRGATTYRGDVTITFDDAGSGDTFLDFRGKTIERLEVNGRLLPPIWTGYRLTLPGEVLTPHNTVRAIYENEYDHTGDGLHQFVDPEDGEEYIYTNFEPYEAHRLFPCFDQPDIKATYRLTVVAPAGWEVIANGRETASRTLDDDRVEHIYEQTRRFSTYLFAIVAGPYHVERERHKGLPLALFCRKSMVKYLEPDLEELWEVTKRGLDFYEEFFAYPYPFTKYDQVFVPEFNAGAMENVAAVTHSETYIFRDPPTENQRRTRAETLLHEMAHMWFGNLVTMRWWNDLWLNESFATYMSYLAMERATRFRGVWEDFHAGMKAWAYRQDQLVTTHPIAGSVADTDETFLNFDGITYGKGAAVLKQLVATIGLERFREGMRRYFQRHEWSNATLTDFLTALQEGSGHDLLAWARLWLETPSLNTLAAIWESDQERLTSLALRQTAPPEYPTLRPHALEIALGVEQNGSLVIRSLPVRIDEAETVVETARGLPQPVLVFPNHNDHAFAKVALDPVSLDYVRAHLERVSDPLLRTLLWTSLWHMVRDQQLRSTDYLRLVADKIGYETDLELIETTLGYAQGALTRFVPEAQREAAFHAFCQRCWEGLKAAPQGDHQIVWARALIAAAAVPADIELVQRLADGQESVPGLTVDQDMRWAIAVKAVAYGMPGAEERVAAEHRRDASDRGQRAVLRAQAARPLATAKAEAWARFHGEGYGSLHLTAAAMSGFHWTVQRDLCAPYVERFFEAVSEVFEKRTKEFATAYFTNLFPHYRIEQAVLARSERLLNEIAGKNALLERMLREANDDLQRAIKCRAFAAA